MSKLFKLIPLSYPCLGADLIVDELNCFDNLSSIMDSSNEDSSDELDLYLKANPEKIMDPFTWWIEQQDTYSQLSWMAIDFLTIPGTYVILWIFQYYT